jgi:hypothetical protein
MNAAKEARVGKLLAALEAPEVVAMLLADWKEERESPASLGKSLDPRSARRAGHLLRSATTATRTLGWYLVTIEAYTTQLELKASWLETFRMWAVEAQDTLLMLEQATRHGVPDWVIADLTESGAMYEAITAETSPEGPAAISRIAVVGAHARDLGPSVTEVWQMLRSVSVVAATIAEDIAGEEPLFSHSRELVDRCTHRIVALAERVSVLVGREVALSEPSPDQVQVLERHGWSGGRRV